SAQTGVVVAVTDIDESLSAPVLSSTSTATSSLSIDWDAVVGATYYSVAVTGSATVTTTDTDYVLTDLTPNSAYTIVITAFDDEGNSSDGASTTLYTDP